MIRFDKFITSTTILVLTYINFLRVHIVFLLMTDYDSRHDDKTHEKNIKQCIFFYIQANYNKPMNIDNEYSRPTRRLWT